MPDEQFDEIARRAFSAEPRSVSEATWQRVKPRRWSWVPSIPETLACGLACALLLFFLSLQTADPLNYPEVQSGIVTNALVRGQSGLQESMVWIADSPTLNDESLNGWLPHGSLNLDGR